MFNRSEVLFLLKMNIAVIAIVAFSAARYF